MKYKILCLIFIYSFIATQSCTAMENQPKPLTLIKELNKIPRYARVTHLTDKTIIIKDTGGCYLMNIDSEEIASISNKLGTMILHPNKQKIAYIYENKLQLYTIKTKESELLTPSYSIDSLAFNPHDKKIFLYSQDYHTKNKLDPHSVHAIDNNIVIIPYSCFAFHLKKPILYTLNVEKDCYYVSTYHVNDLITKLKNVKLPEFCSYHEISTEGITAFMEPSKNKIYIINLNNNDDTFKTLANAHNDYMCFYPNSSILMTASISNNDQSILYFWDTNTLQCIYKALIPSLCGVVNISLNEKNVILRTCIENYKLYAIPDKVRYEGRKQFFNFLLFSLKNYADRNNLPIDIVRYIIATYWNA